jgi:hypothetical protein
MKKVREYLNEKFEEESDHNHDLGIGRIIFNDYYKEFEKDLDTALEKWKIFLKQFEGRTIKGTMFLYSGKIGNWIKIIDLIKVSTISIAHIDFEDADNIFIEADNGKTYLLDLYEEYLIK